MKIRIHENGWTTFIEDFDLREATQRQMNTIAKLIATNTVVVLRDQHLTPQDEIAVCEKIGKLESFAKNREIKPSDGPPIGFIVKGTDAKMLRVSGELDEHGYPGLFGHVSDLDWHANQTANEWRDPIVWLYGIKGTKGSRTSWINNIMTYNDLSEEDKEYYKTIKMINGYKQGAYSESHFGKHMDINYMYTPNLVHTNNGGQTGLFFPFLQIHQIVGMDEQQSLEFIQKLRSHVEQEKYMYHHDWEDNDVVFHEQWLGVHKRWRFENMASRELHRLTFGYQNCDISDTDHL
jgi:alpha-ketoglutarate-dependent taurine dioxygenase